IKTGKCNLSEDDAHAAITSLNIDIAIRREKVLEIKRVLRNYPIGHPEAIEMRAKIEEIGDDIKLLNKRKTELKKRFSYNA
ncbi:MAG: hypothetical protein V1839_00935, partial [archaeon]